jgi:DNA-binding MarR family transcriptional regulator
MKSDRNRDLLDEADQLGHEARAGQGDHAALRLWLRLLATTTQIETDIRGRLREAYGISLARFDYLAQLYRFRDGLKMSALSRYLMVTGGNVTALTDELSRDGLVSRDADPADRRSWVVRLTPKGRKAFQEMAETHEGWVVELLGGLDERTRSQLHEGLGRLRVALVKPADAQWEDPK